MQVTSRSERHLLVEFASSEELDAEYEANLKARGLALMTTERFPALTVIQLTLRVAELGEITVAATVVALYPGGLALSIDTDPARLVADLKTPAPPAPEPAIVAAVAPDAAPDTNAWERLRALPHSEKLILAGKADRGDRMILAQEGDPQVLYFLLKNPRITQDEVARIARSSYLSFQGADLIAKTPQWLNNDVRIGLVANPRTPTPLALRILPSLPPNEIKQIARGSAVSPALRQAALRLVMAM
ncbi:MAG: hypothetical protein ABIT01_10360 [Thermoanaerobaculia bacterium]